MQWLDEPMDEMSIGGVSDPKGIWRDGIMVDPHPTWEGLPRHQPGEPDEPGFLDYWWAGVCANTRPGHIRRRVRPVRG